MYRLLWTIPPPMKQKIQLIEREIKDKFELVCIIEKLDYDFEKFTGIAFLDNLGLNCILASISVENIELFPKNFEVLFLQSNIFSPPESRFFTIHNCKAKGNKLKMEFKDGGTAGSYPYTLKIYLRLENINRSESHGHSIQPS